MSFKSRGVLVLEGLPNHYLMMICELHLMISPGLETKLFYDLK